MDGRTGAAFCVFLEDTCIHTWKCRLHDHNTVYQAEAFAIMSAVTWHVDHHPDCNLLVATDSQSVLAALRKTRQNDNLLQRLLKLMLDLDVPFKKLFWIKAHQGTLGNEIADLLAKQAANLPSPSIDLNQLPIPKATLKRLLKESSLAQWQERWATTSKGRHTFKFLPTVSRDDLLDCPLINQLLTGRGPFPAFLHFIQKLDSPNCVCSGYGDVLHYMFQCPLTVQFHFRDPLPAHLPHWLRQLRSSRTLTSRLRALMLWIKAHEFELQPP